MDRLPNRLRLSPRRTTLPVGAFLRLILLFGVVLAGPSVSAQAPSDAGDDEWTFEEDLSGDDELVDPEVAARIERYAARLYRNRERGYEQIIEGLGYLRELSFNESMRATEKDFAELFGEALGELILGGLGLELPGGAGLDVTDLPSLVPLLEAWGKEISPGRPSSTVGAWIQAQWDQLRLLKADLPDPEVLAGELRSAYAELDDEERIDFEIWLDEALETERSYREPDPLLVEQRFWEQWINAHFAGGDLDDRTCSEAGGCLELWLEAERNLVGDADFRLAAAEVLVPGADVVTAGLQRVMRKADGSDRGPWRRRVRLLDFAVPKRVCIGSYADWEAERLDRPLREPSPCGWLGPDNHTLASPEDPDLLTLFENRSWRIAGGGGSLEVIGWE